MVEEAASAERKLARATRAHEGTERALMLCARPEPSPEVARALSQLAQRDLDFPYLLARAEQEGLGALLYAHFKGLPEIPADALRDMRAMQLRHRALHQRRSQVLSRVVHALAEARLPALLLKGSAVSLLAYPEPYQRCMRDLDILVRAQDAQPAARALAAIGFRCPHEDWDDHYHLATRDIEIDGVTVSVELHKKVQWELPWTLEERWPESQAVRGAGFEARTLGVLDTLYLAYLHGFGLSMRKSEGFRLIWVADIHGLVETFCERIDPEELTRRHPKLARALPWFGVITPWSERVIRHFALPAAELARAGDLGALPLSTLRDKGALARAVRAPLVWAGIRHGLAMDKAPRWVKRAKAMWIACSDR